jgi:hypothetical protein
MKFLTGIVERSTGKMPWYRTAMTGRPPETKNYLERLLFWGLDTFCDFIWKCMCLLFWLLAIGSSHAGHELSTNEFTDFIVAAFHWVTAGLH